MQKTMRLTTILLGLYFLISPLSANAAQWLILENAAIIDATGRPEVHHKTLTIRDNLIVGNNERPAEDDTIQVIDLKDKYILPGLIDGHVHLSGIGNDTEVVFKRLLKGGVTSVRDMSGDARLLAVMKRDIDAGTIVGPTIHYSATFGGPTFFEDPRVIGSSIGYEVGKAPWALKVTTESNLSELIAMARGAGATGIKIYADLGPELTAALIAEGRRQGMQIWTHATIFPTKPSEIVATGGEVLSHITYMVWEGAYPVPDSYVVRRDGPFSTVSPDDPQLNALFESMAEKHAMIDATLYIAVKFFSEESQDWTFSAAQNAHRHGVELVAGTDDFLDRENDNLPNLHQELKLFVEKVGLTPAEAIRTATYNAARAMGMEAERGTLSEGMFADLLVLNRNPLNDITATQDIYFVVKNGKIVE